MQYAIEFREPGTRHAFYAGEHKGGLGFAPTLKTALFWDDEETATRFLRNGYGPAMNEIGRVIRVHNPSPAEVRFP